MPTASIGGQDPPCRHRCCPERVRHGHLHLHPPEHCFGCSAAAASVREAAHDEDIAVITAAVMRTMVPCVRGLPEGRLLDRVVADRVQAVRHDGLADPQLADLDESDWRAAIAARVGLALAFPNEWDPATNETAP